MDRLRLDLVNAQQRWPRWMLIAGIPPLVLGLGQGLWLLSRADAELLPMLVVAYLFGALATVTPFIGAVLVWRRWQRWKHPHLSLVLDRHHLTWGDRRVALEDVRRVESPVDRLLVVTLTNGEVLQLSPELEAKPATLQPFLQALSERVQVLTAAEERPEARARLQSLRTPEG